MKNLLTKLKNRKVLAVVGVTIVLVLGIGTYAIFGLKTQNTGTQSGGNVGKLHIHDGKQRATLYTCSMHPQVLQDQPGTCPICGMDLVSTHAPSAEDEPKAKSGDRKIKHWKAPMDPTYISDKPGKSPMGMDLVPVYEDEGMSDGNKIRIDPVVAQNMAIRIAHAQKGTVIRNVRTIGEVEVAEDQVSVVNLRFSGWVEKIWADQTQKKVKKGERLFQIYSPELIAAQDEFLLALKEGGRADALTEASEKRLKLWEIPKYHIEQLVKKKDGQLRLIVRAPRDGYILHKNVLLGKKVNAGQDLYRIGNLTKIWVKAEVYEHDAPWIELGQSAEMSLSFQEGRTFDGKVGFIYPTLNKGSRTLTIRLEFENPGLNLKPGMFATVYIQARRKEGVITVPTEAVIHSGSRKIIFVSPKLGQYEPREVTIGLIGDNRQTEILTGINESEVVVVSGQFLLDSESQLQEAIQKLMRARLQAKNQPAAKPEEEKKAEDHTGHEHKKTYTCPMHPQVIKPEPGRCPICGMDLVKKNEEKKEPQDD